MPERVGPRRVVRRAPAEPEEEEEFEPKDDEEEEERPARGLKGVAGKAKTPFRGGTKEGPKKPPLRTGWGGAHRTKEMGGDFADELKLDDEHVLIKFLEDEPSVSYRQHWVERKGKKSWTCAEDNCPLCDIGSKAAGKYAFNVLLLSDGEPINKVWIVGTRLVGTLENYAQDPKTGPLTRLYWAVNRTSDKKGKNTGGNVQTNVNPVKERDLGEDWEIEPLEDDVIEMYTGKGFAADDIIQYHTRKQLLEIAKELSDELDDDDA